MLSASEKIRVRFAPSPTGKLHLGSLRTALFNFLYAKKYGGNFILRIEDTDQDRIVPGCSHQFEQILDLFGLKRDESPQVGGEYGPYLQSERLSFYRDAKQQLIESKHAYFCFCSTERLDILRRNSINQKMSFKYDGRCRNLSESEIRERIRNAEKPVVRFKYEPKNFKFMDGVFGEYVQDTTEGDFVLIKRDEFPTYHFACVVDDHLMNISTVIRGSEWLYSTPKHIRLFEAFGWKYPKYLHLPLITRSKGRKLSKRVADAMVEYYTNQQGYLPLAVLNFLVRNGAGIKGHESGKLYELNELIERFDENLITRNNFTMDQTVLDNYGRLAFQKASSSATLLPCIQTYLLSQTDSYIDPNLISDSSYINRVINFLKRNEEAFSKLSDLANGDFRFFFSRPSSPDRILNHFPDHKMVIHLLTKLHQLLLQANGKVTLTELKSFATEEKVEYPELMKMFRLALIDSQHGPPITELLSFFSEEECTSRLKKVLEMITTDLNARESPQIAKSYH